MGSLRVAYILQYFPRLTETFVADEIQAVCAQGVDVQIVSLLTPGEGLVSPASRELLSRTWYAPGPFSLGLWRDQIHFVRLQPKLYWRLLVTLLSQPYRGYGLTLFLKRLVTFLKAVSAARYLTGQDIDLLHAHFAWLPAAAAWVSARLLGKPFTVTVHAYDLYSQKNDLTPLIAREAAHLVAISEFNRSHLATLAAEVAPITLIHCGVDLSGPATEPGDRSQVAGSPLRILSVGSLVDKKGHRFLISACKILREQGVDFTCTIIGAGPQEEALRRQIDAAQLQQLVELLGARTHPEVLASYPDFDVFVLPSVITADGDRDGIPVVLIEAGSAGLPLVSSPISGIPEVVLHEQTGLLVPPGDPVSLAEAIRVLAQDPGLRARLGQNARERIRDRFDIQGTSAQLRAVFQSTVRNRAPQASAV